MFVDHLVFQVLPSWEGLKLSKVVENLLEKLRKRWVEWMVSGSLAD